MQKLTKSKKNLQSAESKWVLFDAANVRLGKLSAEIARLLLGKSEVDRADYFPSGNHVVVINSDKVAYYPTRERRKLYYRHSGFPGGFKSISLGDQLSKDSRQVIFTAVSGMLPKNKLRGKLLAQLYVFKNAEHKHQAQQPELLTISK